MSLLQVLVGLPGSGKSTFARKRAKEGAVIVDIDCIVSMVHGGDYGAYDRDFDPVYKAIEMASVTSALFFGKDVVFDKCCQKASTRRRLLELGRQLGARVEAVVLKTGTPEDFLARRMKYPKGQLPECWKKVIDTRVRLYEKVELTEGFDRIIEVSQQVWIQ